MFFVRLLAGTATFIAASTYGIGAALLRRDRSRVAHDYAQRIARWMRPAFGLRVRVIGQDKMLVHRPCVYISNHQSIYDVPILASLYPPDTVIIGKKELRGIPLFGWIYDVTGNVFIDRSQSDAAVGRLREAEAAIRDKGQSVWIFPEGTRGSTPGELLPFKKGAFHMAIATGVPVVPVVVGPFHELWDLKHRHIRPGTVEVRVLDPIQTHGMTPADLASLLEETHARMSAALQDMIPARSATGDEPARVMAGG